MIDRIALVTDFGVGGPYVGQMKLLLSGLLPQIPIIDLVCDLAPFRPDLAAYLLPALARDMPAKTLYLCVVDPGVGGDRAALAVEAGGDWYVGPDNGLLALVARFAARPKILRVDWRPKRMADSFHGRDLFCPLVAKLIGDRHPESVALESADLLGSDWPDALFTIIYADRYGNLITAIPASHLDKATRLRAGGQHLAYARTFCEVPPGRAFWYENSFGLVELAVNQGSARISLGVGPGDPVGLSQP
jgi:S-adenosylmethionine hydrolase